MKNLMDQTEQAISQLRDRTASTLAADDTSEYRHGLTRRAIEQLSDRIDDLEETMTDSVRRLRSDLVDDSTSWWTRLTWLAIGAGLGTAAASMFADDERREQLRATAEERAQMLKLKAQELADDAQHQLDVQKGKAEGVRNLVTGGRDTEDPKLLRQKIRSEVIGRVEGADDVVVVVHDGGEVELKGLVEARATLEELLESIEKVPGVTSVTESVQVNAASS